MLSCVTVETSRFLHNFQTCTNTAEAWSGLDSAPTEMQPEFLYALEEKFLHLVEYLDVFSFCLMGSEFEVRLPSTREGGMELSERVQQKVPKVMKVPEHLSYVETPRERGLLRLEKNRLGEGSHQFI